MSTLLTPMLPPSLNSPDGVRLHVHHWPVAQPRGIVQMAHGMLEHLGRYQELAALLNTAGWAVAGVDHRGHGLSSGERGAIREADDLLRDQAQLHDQLSRAYRHLPHVLLGSSLGGVIAARMAAELTQPSSGAPWSRPLDGIVLIAPALEPTMSAPQRATLSVLSRLVPDLGIPVAHRPDWITSDPAVIAEINADKLIHHTITPRITQFMVSAARGVFERAPGWATPTLLMYSEIDRLVSAEACRRFHSLVPAHLMKAYAYHDMAHDLIHEPGRELVFEHLRNWLDSLS
jgi:alpha-beta hydrolase superfamily lysophospholipase